MGNTNNVMRKQLAFYNWYMLRYIENGNIVRKVVPARKPGRCFPQYTIKCSCRIIGRYGNENE